MKIRSFFRGEAADILAGRISTTIGDLTPQELQALQALVKEGVFQGVVKAIGVYLLLSALVGAIIAIVQSS